MPAHQHRIGRGENFSRKRRGIRPAVCKGIFPWSSSGQRFPQAGGGPPMFGDRCGQLHVEHCLAIKACAPLRSMSSMERRKRALRVAAARTSRSHHQCSGHHLPSEKPIRRSRARRAYPFALGGNPLGGAKERWTSGFARQGYLGFVGVETVVHLRTNCMSPMAR